MENKDDKLYIYVFVRTDIPIQQQLVQACHASSMGGEAFGNGDSSMVLLGVNNVDQLLEISQMLDFNQIPHVMFHEPDWDMGYSALATKSVAGAERKKVRKIISKLDIQMWK